MRSKKTDLKCWAGGGFGSPACPNKPVGREAGVYRDGKLVSGRRLACAEHGALDEVCVMDAFVDFHEGWANTPTLAVLLNRHPRESERVYEKRGQLYYSNVEGIVRFYAWGGKPDRGYGGAHYKIKLTDGSEEELIGPWSASPAAMHAVGFEPSVDTHMAYMDDSFSGGGEAVFEKGFTFMGGHISLALALEACRLCQGTSLMWVGETLIPVKLGQHATVIGEPPAPREPRFGDHLSTEQGAVIRA